MARKETEITLYKGVPFDDTYKHIVNWDNEEQLRQYLLKFPHKIMMGSFQNINRPIRWNSGAQGFNDLTEYNYVRINLNDSIGSTKAYYAFITDLEYKNDGTTLIFYSIDMWNTYMYNITQYGNAMIERGFVKEINEQGDNFTDLFKSTLRVKEDIGGDGCQRLIRQTYFLPMIANGNGNYTKAQTGEHKYFDDSVAFLVFTAQPKDAKTEYGSRFLTYSQYRTYIVAYNLLTLKVYTLQVDGKEAYKYNKEVPDLFQDLAQDEELVGSSSLIVDAEQYSYIGLPYQVDYEKNIINFRPPKGAKVNLEKKNNLCFVKHADGFRPQKLNAYLYEDGSSIFTQLVSYLREIYGEDVPLKIMANPYMSMLVTDGRGTDLQLNPALFNSYKEKYFYLWRFGGLSENGKEVLSMANYMRDSDVDNNIFINSMNAMAVNDSPKDVPVVSDTYEMYLQSNRNQLRNTRANAKMNMILAKEGNAVSLQNTNRSLANNSRVTGFQNAQRSRMANYNMATGILSGAAGGLMHGSPLGALTGAAGGAINGMIGIGRTNIENQTAAGVTAMNNATAAANAEANYAFQNKVATNNYEQTLRTQNAMLADIKNSNDTIAHQGSNNQWEYENANFNPALQIFRCEWQTIQNVITYFKLFGYAIGQYMRIDMFLNVKSNFNYIKTSNAYIRGNLPQPAIDTINTMLDNGVTFWNPSALDKFEVRNTTDNNFN